MKLTRLKELREQNGLSMLQLSKKINASDAAICKWENGTHEPKASYIYALADYFQITTDELLGRENYGTGNVEIKGEVLSDKEKQLVAFFRTLDEKIQQDTALQILEAAFPASQRKSKNSLKIS